MWHESFAGVYFCGLAIFYVLRELIFLRLGQIGFSSWESTQHSALTIFSFLFSTCNRNAYFLFYGLHQYFIVYRFVSEHKRQVVIQQTRFLSTIFLRSEYKLENIYSGVNLYGNFYLRQFTQKLEPAKFRATRYVSFCINRC